MSAGGSMVGKAGASVDWDSVLNLTMKEIRTKDIYEVFSLPLLYPRLLASAGPLDYVQMLNAVLCGVTAASNRVLRPLQ